MSDDLIDIDIDTAPPYGLPGLLCDSARLPWPRWATQPPPHPPPRLSAAWLAALRGAWYGAGVRAGAVSAYLYVHSRDRFYLAKMVGESDDYESAVAAEVEFEGRIAQASRGPRGPVRPKVER